MIYFGLQSQEKKKLYIQSELWMKMIHNICNMELASLKYLSLKVNRTIALLILRDPQIGRVL